MEICRRSFGALLLGGAVSRTFALPSPPKLLVLVVLEQFRPDYLSGIPTQPGGGFRRILDGGSFFPDCRHAASTFTSSALATLATGAWPAQHGIVADIWYDRGAQRAVAASPELLGATTLASEAAADPRSRVFVVASEQAHARLFAGTSAASSFWMDDRGVFSTAGETPGWLENYNRLKPLENLRGAKWMAVGARPGTPPLRTLTFDEARPEEFLRLYKSSPFAQAAEFEFLGELIGREQIGQGSTIDVVCLLCGAPSQLGYETGARSPLMHDMVLQTDRHLGFLLDSLDRATGEDGYNLVVTAAHGAPQEPSLETRPRMAVNGELMAQSIDKALGVRGEGRVRKFVYPFVWLEPAVGRDPESVRASAGRAAMATTAVAGFFTSDGACSTHSEWERRFRNSFHPTRSGDVMLSYRPNYVEDFGAGRGVSYGSIYNYDACVPLCLYGTQFRAGTFEGPVESIDVAPTLARALGFAQPSSSSGRVLGEAFAENVRSKK